MSNKNDKKIMELKEQIERKKREIGSPKAFKSVTSCIMPDANGARSSINLRVLNKEKVVNLMIDINIKIMSAKDLGIESEYEIAGFKASDWIKDLKGRLDELNVREEEKKLKTLEEKLDKMLSEEKQTELELENIANLI